MALPRPKALSGINGEELVRSTSSETIHLSMNDLLEERRRFEQYTRDQNARLSRLRELMNEERAAASADLERRRAEIVAAATDKLKAELDESRHLWQEQEQALARTQADYHAARAEIQRLRSQFEEIPRLRQQLDEAQADVARRTAEQAELDRRCRLHELAANETALLREELQRVKEEYAHHQRASENLNRLRSEFADVRAEVEMLRRREAGHLQKLEGVLAAAAAQRRQHDEQRAAIAGKAQELYRLAQQECTTQPPP